MDQIVTAVYEKGVLRPLVPLELQEHQAVRIQVLADEEAQREVTEEAIRVLVAAGLMRQPQLGTSPPDPVSEERRRALADRLGQASGTPLSELVLKDRGKR